MKHDMGGKHDMMGGRHDMGGKHDMMGGHRDMMGGRHYNMGDHDYDPDMDYMGGDHDDEMEYGHDRDMMGPDHDDEMDYDYMHGMDDMDDAYEGADVSTPMVGDPDDMPDDLEALHDISDEYEGMDPEDLDLDLDVNEADYETGRQRKNTGVKGGGASADTTDANLPMTRHGKTPDAVKKGGTADTSGGQGEIRPDQRKPKESGSELPKRGRGTSEPQKAAKMAEAVVKRALPDLANAWRQGDPKKGTKILRFIEHAVRCAHGQLQRQTKRAGRTRFLQTEVARLEDENIRLRALTEAMAEVQRTEVLMYERKLLLKDHPQLAAVEETLERCDTVQDMHKEAEGLLKLLGNSKPTPEGTDPKSGEPLDEDVKPEPKAGTFVMKRPASSGTSLASSAVAKPAAQPLAEAMVASAPDLKTPPARPGGDTASRLAAHRRRRRGG